jgi:hypothetical protein
MSLKQQTSQQSITRQLTRMNLLVSGIALLLACAAFSAYDWVTYRPGFDDFHQLGFRARVQ